MTNYKARQTVYNGILMRSRLEAGFASWLDRNGFKWEYEPCAFSSPAGQYLPDFRLVDLRCSWSTTPVTAYVDVKPDGWGERRDHSRCEFEPAVCPCSQQWMSDQFDVIAASEPDAIFLTAEPRPAGPAEYEELWTLATIFAWPYDGNVKMRWPTYKVWKRDDEGLVLSSTRRPLSGALRHDEGPWHGDWWKVR